MGPFGSGVGPNNVSGGGLLLDAPQKEISCSVARYAFEAYQTPAQPYVSRGTAGTVSVTFLDEAFVQRSLNCPGGGLLEVTFTDGASVVQQSFAAAELSVELCSLSLSSSSSSSIANVIPAHRTRIWGGAVKVAPSSKAPILLGVRDKTQDVLHLTLYDSDPTTARAGAGASALRSYVATVPLSDVPEGANVPPAVMEVTLQQLLLQQQQQEVEEAVPVEQRDRTEGSTTDREDAYLAGAAKAAANTATATVVAITAAAATTAAANSNSSSVSFSWRLIPFSACKLPPPQQRQARRLLSEAHLQQDMQMAAELRIDDMMPINKMPINEMRIEEMRDVITIVKGLCDEDNLKDAQEALAEVEGGLDLDQRLPRQLQLLQLPQQAAAPPPPDWDEINRLAGGPNLQPVAVVQCADKFTQLWIHRDSMDGTVVVAFRGTERSSLPNWSIDLNTWFVRPDDLNPADAVAADQAADTNAQVLVHKGFLDAYLDMRHAIMGIVGALVFGRLPSGTASTTATGGAAGANGVAPAAASSDGVNGGGDPSNCTRVIFTGHSLGGAMATLAAYDLAARKKDGFYSGDVQLFTLGSPRVGNQAFMEAFNSLVPYAWRFTNTTDIVPRLPYGSIADPHQGPIPYFHVGAHWDLEKPEADPALRVGLAADSGEQRALIEDWTPLALWNSIMAHLGPAYRSGIQGFFQLGGSGGRN